jgi:hypothetical protein
MFEIRCFCDSVKSFEILRFAQNDTDFFMRIRDDEGIVPYDNIYFLSEQ